MWHTCYPTQTVVGQVNCAHQPLGSQLLTPFTILNCLHAAYKIPNSVSHDGTPSTPLNLTCSQTSYLSLRILDTQHVQNDVGMTQYINHLTMTDKVIFHYLGKLLKGLVPMENTPCIQNTLDILTTSIPLHFPSSSCITPGFECQAPLSIKLPHLAMAFNFQVRHIASSVCHLKNT